MTTTTSPVMERTHSEKLSRFSNVTSLTEKKKPTTGVGKGAETRNSNISKKSGGTLISKTIEIKEAQNEDEDHHERKGSDVNK
jgi:hypothetical protein